MALLEVEDLIVEFQTRGGKLRAVDRISFQLEEGESLGIVGESGSGKSITSLALMGLLPYNASISANKMNFMGRDLLSISEDEQRLIRGGDIAMIFQDPMTSLNPSFNVEFQLSEALKIHQGGTKQEIYKKVIELLGQVGIPAPEARLKSYPHQLSGGMSQRIMIAMAIACNPKLLIADEPTTALDVTIQAQIMDLLLELQNKKNMALMLITHDMAVVSETTKNLFVMYAGQIVEQGRAEEMIQKPMHPYTNGLLESLPGTRIENGHRSRLKSIPGVVPDLLHRPKGCQLSPRCSYAQDKCKVSPPENEIVKGREVKCFFPLGGDHG